MRLETNCSALLYTMHDGEPAFLAELDCNHMIAVPKAELYIKESDREADRAILTGKTSLAVRLDKVFRHDARDHGVVCLAEVNPEEYKTWDSEELRLDWMTWPWNSDGVRDESDRELLKHAAAYLAVKLGLRENPVKESGYIWYREHAVDIHSHIIPGADDGAQTMGETHELLCLDREEGIQWVFATPHYGEENGYAPEREMVSTQYRELSQFLFLSSSPVKASLGTEWYCAEDIVERIRRQEAFPMGDSDWYMVEFLEWGSLTEDAETILRRLKRMKDNGIKTILAHPERYKALQQDRDLAKRICDLGVRLQGNAYDLFLNPKAATRNLAQWMATEELISFIGSDMHGTGFKPDGKPKRRPQMKEGIQWLYDHVDYDYACEIVRVNAERYLGVEKLLK